MISLLSIPCQLVSNDVIYDIAQIKVFNNKEEQIGIIGPYTNIFGVPCYLRAFKMKGALVISEARFISTYKAAIDYILS